MKLNCPECQAVYSIDDALISSGGVKAQCPACGKVQVVRLGAPPEAEAPVPGSWEQTTEPSSLIPPPLGSEAAPEVQEPPTLPGAKADDSFSAPQLTPPVPPPTPSPRPEPPPAPPIKPLEPPPGRTAGEDRCERCGGVVPPGTGIGGLCDRCRSIEQESAIRPGDREWRVQKADGVILGPLTLDEVKMKFRRGEVTATDRVARGEAEFRLISSYAEFSEFFRRPGEAFQMTFKHPPPSHRGRNLAILVVLGLALAGASGWYLWSRMGDTGGDEEADVRKAVLEMFSQEIPTPTGSAAGEVASGRKFMLLDDRLSYLQADKAFKTALLLDPDNAEACAGWVQNRAMLDRRRGDVAMRKTALDLVDYFLHKGPEDPRLHRAKAFLLFSLGRHEEAREHAQMAKDKLEDDAESLLILGATYLESSTDMAVGMLKRALDANTELNVAYRFLGEAAIRQGRFHRALGYFKKRLQKDPGEFEALASSARVYQAVGQFDRAVDTYEIILAAAPHRAEALVALARLHTQVLKNPRKALAVLDGAMQLGDKLPAGTRAQILTEHSIAHRILGNSGKASASAGSAIQADPMCIPALYARAVLEHEAGRVDPGLAHLRELQVHMPQSARLRARIAEMESLVPNFQKAHEELKRAIEMAPNDLDIHLMMAVFQGFVDSPSQAYAGLQKSMAIDPFFDQAHGKVSAFYDGAAFLKITVQRALQTAGKYEEDALFQALCGIVLLRGGHADQAKNRLHKALSLDAECFQANLYLGVLALLQKKNSAAVGYLQQAHETDALHPMAAKLLGRAYLQQGKLKMAGQVFKNVLLSAPGDLEARLGLGEVYLKARKKNMAARMLLKVYQGDEDNLWAKRLLFELGH